VDNLIARDARDSAQAVEHGWRYFGSAAGGVLPASVAALVREWGIE